MKYQGFPVSPQAGQFQEGDDAMQSQKKKTPETNVIPPNSSPPRQRPVFSSGIPIQLKKRTEAETGLSFDDVRVHYNSGRPRQIEALAYTQGSQVYLGPGQAHLLPHELSHVIQQKTGRIKPDSTINGLPVNTDPRLEQQADSLSLLHHPAQQQSISSPVVQRYSNFAYPQNTNAVYNFGFHRDIYYILKEDAPPPPLRSRASAPPARRHTGGTPPVSCFNDTGSPLRKEFTRRFATGIERSRLPFNERDINSTSFSSLISRPNSDQKLVFTFLINGPDYSEIINAFEPVWIGIPDYATGDQFTLAAMLLHRPSTRVLVTGYSGPWNKCQMLQTFEQTLNIQGQVSGGFWRLGDPNNPRVVFKPSNKRYHTSHPIKTPSYATQTVGQNYNSEWKTNLRTAWELPTAVHRQDTAVSNALNSWITKINPKLGELLPNLHKHNIIVLWLRHSSANGGAHLEHDTGTTATLTLIEMLLLRDPSNLIILAGDRKDKQISKIIISPWAERIFDFTEFWKNADADPTGWGGNTRMGQSRFYDCLNATAHSLRHIGSRSGNLELMALIGHNVDYIEEENSFGGERMVPFNQSTELHYKRIITSRPLTFKGTLTRIVNYLLSRNNELWQLFTRSFTYIGRDQIMEIGKTMSAIAASPSNPFFENKKPYNIPKPFQDYINRFTICS